MRLRLLLPIVFVLTPLALYAADDSKDGGGTTSGTKEAERRREQPPRATPGAVADTPRSGATPVPPPPPLRAGAATVEPPEAGIEPEVTITTKGTEIHEEYRANGRLYMIKVVPAKGKK